MSGARLAPFLAGAVAGVVVGGAVGAGGAALVVSAHPRLAARIAHELQRRAAAPPVDVSGTITVRVDARAAGRPISPGIYGVANADAATLRALGATLDRWGGDNATRYNWVNGHAWNASRDWEFRNGNYGKPTGSTADDFVAGALGSGAQPLLTVPAIGWVARDDDNNTRSVAVPGHGGDAVSRGSDAIPGYDPAANRRRTSVRSEASRPGGPGAVPASTPDAVYQDEWVRHLDTRFGAAPRGVPLYAIDNEPDLWAELHTDVHPVRMGYDDMVRVYEEYATAVKAQDPRALVLGPDVSGWTGYWYSALDRGPDNFATHADRAAHGDQPFLPWWLAQVAAQDRKRGSRSLDYLDVHYYPQGAGVFSDQADPATQALRVRSVRSLDDRGYVDESWIGTQVDLVPRLRAWIDQAYPGTKLAISEYSWGGEKDPSGAVALAQVLGIFGRDGVDLAAYWMFPPPLSPVGAAFRLYRNYDGRGATFGDVSLPAAAGKAGVAAFAARHSGSRELDVVLVNQSATGTAHVSLDLGGRGARATDTYTVAGTTGEIAHDRPAAGASQFQLAPYSATLVRLETS
jgi:hypothetical protein